MLQVGRSCHIVQFKDKKIMLDCGIHPGLTGMDALPFVDMIEADQVRGASGLGSMRTGLFGELNSL